MALDVIYHLPNKFIHHEAFKALSRILGKSRQHGSANWEIILAGGSEGMRNTFFRAEGKFQKPTLELRTDNILQTKPTVSLCAPPHENAITFSELADGLGDSAGQVDHTGVCFSTKETPKEQWLQMVRYVCDRAPLYDYPAHIDGYIPGPMNWLFAISEGPEVASPDKPQPKFEMVYDEGTEHPLIQIDIETGLSKPQLQKIFGNKLFEIPGLGDFFASLRVNGFDARFRVDLRFDSSPGENDWNSARVLMRDGRRVRSVRDLLNRLAT